MPRNARKIAALLITLMVPACAANKTPPVSTLLQNVREVQSDGKTTAVPEDDLSSFQRLVRGRVRNATDIQELLTFEIDMPLGEGHEGLYLEVRRSKVKWGEGERAELRFMEQLNHAPRRDRFFHRTMSMVEIAELYGFLDRHPLSKMHITRGGGAAEPATQPAATQPLFFNPTTQPAEPEEVPDLVRFRITRAHAKSADMIVLDSPSENDHPAIDFLKIISKLRNAAPLACAYAQPIPTNATLLFAEPHRRVLRVWAKGQDIRALIVDDEPEPDASSSDQWYEYDGKSWKSSEAPPEPEPVKLNPESQPAQSQPATIPAPLVSTTQPATAFPAFSELPTLPEISVEEILAALAPPRMPPSTSSSRFSNPELFSRDELWSASPEAHHTVVSHYLPLNSFTSQSVEFIVPVFIFDSEHMHVDSPHGLIYLIHDGQLFALPIPTVARMQR